MLLNVSDLARQVVVLQLRPAGLQPKVPFWRSQIDCCPPPLPAGAGVGCGTWTRFAGPLTQVHLVAQSAKPLLAVRMHV